MEQPAPTQNLNAKRRRRWFWWCGLILLFALGIFTAIRSLRQQPILVPLADGRILVIEGVTYGTRHRIGQPSATLNRFRPWLPDKICRLLEPKHPESKIELKRPALIVWINALDAKSGTNVDCQMLRFECVSSQGDVFRSHPNWFGTPNFWRVGHVFECWPRDEQKLTWRITPYRTNHASQVTLANPHVSAPAAWTGKPLPQGQAVGSTELILTGLTLRTTGGSGRYWETPAVFWEPVWEFRREGMPASGWNPPEWLAEDPLGNRGQQLGTHQPVLKFLADVYPTITEPDAVKKVALLPPINLAALQTNTWWNLPLVSTNLIALGICPPGVWSFSAGQVDTNPVSKMGPVRGGAPSGWTGARKQINPLQAKTTSAHYTPSPTIYLYSSDPPEAGRLAIRVTDEQGRIFALKPEPQGSADGVHPFLMDLPSGITNISAEVVMLMPVHAEFYVKTESAAKP